MGFKNNPYEQCITNKLINEDQCTIGSFADDNMISHMDDNFNSMISDKIEVSFEKLSCTTGEKHIFIGMEIEFIGGKEVTVSTPHHVVEPITGYSVSYRIPEGDTSKTIIYDQ